MTRLGTGKAVRVLDALAQEHRLAVVRLLCRAPRHRLAAGAIGDALGLPTSLLSFHLAQLRIVGLISQERQGRSLIYSARPDMIEALIRYLLENCRDA